MLPTNSEERKDVPIASGCLDYFPDAIAAVATVSRIGNEQHNPGQPLHWDRSKSTDHDDALMRHFLERGTADTDGQLHRAKVAWRALAALQEEIECNTSVIVVTYIDPGCVINCSVGSVRYARRHGSADRRKVTDWAYPLRRRTANNERRKGDASWLTLPEGKDRV